MWTRFGATNARSSGLSSRSSLKVSPTCCIPRQIPVSDAPLLILFHAVLTPEVYEFPDGQFAGLQKAPNVAINVPNAIMPIIVVESGWSGSLDRLREDADEWLVGGNGAVQAAVIINWTANRTTHRIRGVVELYTLDKSGMPRLQQREVRDMVLLSSLCSRQLTTKEANLPSSPGHPAR